MKDEIKFTTCPVCMDPIELYMNGVRSNYCPMCGHSLKGLELKIELIQYITTIIPE